MIDTADLPVRVRQAVEALDHAPPAAQAGQLRVLAAYAHRFMVTAWQQRNWVRVIDELGLILGYLTAANRVEEGTPS